jgi:hypothetical protein
MSRRNSRACIQKKCESSSATACPSVGYVFDSRQNALEYDFAHLVYYVRLHDPVGDIPFSLPYPVSRLQQYSEPQEQTSQVLLLLSEHSSYQTGSEVFIDGGYLIW